MVFEFFAFCEESRVSGLNCTVVDLKPSHGRLYKAMAKREGTKPALKARKAVKYVLEVAGQK